MTNDPSLLMTIVLSVGVSQWMGESPKCRSPELLCRVWIRMEDRWYNRSKFVVMGASPASISKAPEGEVTNPPVIQRAAACCTVANFFVCCLQFLLLGRNHNWKPYVRMGKTTVKNSSRLFEGVSPLNELPSMRAARSEP